MKKISTAIEDCFLYELDRFYDNRGFFQELHKDGVIEIEPKQINWSYSKTDTIRGLHIAPYSKFITCVSGKIYDVVIDMREDSKSYLEKVTITLDSETPTSIYIPGRCAHGFMAITDSTIIYLQTDTYQPNKEKSIHYSYIEWLKPTNDTYILSEKDKNAPLLIKSL